MEKLWQIVQELTKTPIFTRADLNSFKRKIAKKYQLPCPSNLLLFRTYHNLLKKGRLKRNETLEKLLRVRPIRSLSGIVNVSVLTKPYPCPGKCLYCPKEKNLPKSYLKEEPAVQRAILTKFNPYVQVQTRLQSLKNAAHPIDKVELRIIGGTWSYYPSNYQTWFVKECFRACNQFDGKSDNKKEVSRKILKLSSLKELQKKNEKAKCKIVGITVETRPDYINLKEILKMRKLGITRVELGVQSIYDEVLKKVKRGHQVRDSIEATELLKNAGFKVCYQIMLNLPLSSPEKDLKMFEELFKNPNFCPDLLKIYPLALLTQVPLFGWYQKGKFRPYSEKELTDLLIAIKKKIPYWCRVQRVIRDIPSKRIVTGGVKISNLREIVQRKMKEKGLKCKCIRCREVRENYRSQEKPYLFQEIYSASKGKEIFLSFEDKKRERLYALLRLRIPQQNSATILPFLKKTALIREVHTYGQMIPIGEKSASPQHRGLGKKLIREAERITKKQFHLSKIAVISGVGVRDYYRKLGYRLKETYMIKSF